MTRHDTTRHGTAQYKKPALLLCRVGSYITFGILLSNLILGYGKMSVLRWTLFASLGIVGMPYYTVRKMEKELRE